MDNDFLDKNSFWASVSLMFYGIFFLSFLLFDIAEPIVLFLSDYIPLIKKQSTVHGIAGKVGATFIALSIPVSMVVSFCISSKTSFYKRIKHISQKNNDPIIKRLILIYIAFFPLSIAVLAIVFFAPIEINSVSMGGRLIHLISTNIVAMTIFSGLINLAILPFEIVVFMAIKLPYEIVTILFDKGSKS